TVEELVFAHPIFGDTPDIVDKQGIPDHEIISILQATYFICIMQKWEGNENAKLRIQRSRFTDFVAAARGTKLFKTMHGRIETSSSDLETSWREFIHNEERI
ncbi:hypothetical protein DH86_00002994, partial [Scytalidium sp. 3C]